MNNYNLKKEGECSPSSSKLSFKGPAKHSKKTPPSVSTSNGAFMIKQKPDIKRLIREDKDEKEKDNN